MKILKKLFLSFIIFSFLFITFSCCKIFLEPKVYNFMVAHSTAQKTGSDNIVIVVIDDKTIGKFRPPWPRDLACSIFKYFSEYTNARLIIHDAIVQSPDTNNPQADKNYFKFINSLNNFVVGFTFSGDVDDSPEYDKKFSKKFLIPVADERAQKTHDCFKTILRFPQDYFNAVKMVGSVISPLDYYGFLTQMPYFVQYKGNLYPTLSMRAYAYLNNDEKYIVNDKYVIGEQSGLKLKRNSNKTLISANLHFYSLQKHSQYTHKTYSAIDIMDSYEALRKGQKPLINPSDFDNVIVFVGANARAAGAEMSDVKDTPIEDNHPGVDIQATALDNLLNNDFLYPVALKTNIMISLFAALIIFILIKYCGAIPAISLSSIFFVLYFVFAHFLYKNGIAVDVATPTFIGIISMIFSYLHRFVQENINKEKVKNAMGKYMSQDVMQKVVKNIDDLKLGGKKAVVTVLFADIRGFTSLSEKMEADEVSMILNEYFTEIEPIITKYNGVINKFIGDAVMAIFGDPIIDEKHAENAVKCANEMLLTVKKLQHKWLNEGKPKIEIGIGINTGEVFLGNIGSEQRMEYTVIGDTVNLASRLESYNKIYKTNFLISSSTYASVRNIADVIKISEVSIRGKSQKTTIYEVLRLIG